MMNLRIVGVAALLSLSSFAFAEPLNGTKWRTFDDNNGKPKAVVQIGSSGNSLTGTIIQQLEGATITQCTKCSGALKNHSLVGLPVITGLKASGNNQYDHGTILDPLTGKTYKMNVKLSPDAQTLEVRGFVGFSLLGRTQIWKRVN